MARVKGALQITGGIRGVSFYTIKGGDTIFMRTKGGPTKRRMKVGKEFATVRLHQTEWAGCVMFSRNVCGSLFRVYKLADYNISPGLNGLGKRIMKLDTVNEVGKRSILLSECREVLDGFNLNKQFPFNSVYRKSVSLDIHKAIGLMKIQIPRMNAANDLFNVQHLPYFRLFFALSYVPDLVYNEGGRTVSIDKYIPRLSQCFTYGRDVHTAWFSAQDLIPSQDMELNLELQLNDEQLAVYTAMGSVGIQFGTAGPGGVIEEVKNACCAKIERVV